MRVFRPTLALVLSMVLVVMTASPAFADELLTDVNASRHGSVTLLPAADALAQRSADAQAAAGKLSHTNLDPLLDVCSAAGEVVGTGPTVDAIFDAFTASPTHWDIITAARWTSAGTGIAVGNDGALYVSIVFCQDASGAPATTAQAPPMKAAPVARQPAPALESLPLDPCTLDRDLVLHEPPWETGSCFGIT